MKFNTGIYQIINIVNGKKYIGSAVNLTQRQSVHSSLLENNKHHNKYIQNAYNKYGKENFRFEIIMHCFKEDLIFFEQIHIDKYDFDNELYNIALKAGNWLGNKHSDETKKKISKRKKGTPVHTKESKKKLSIANKGEKNPMYGKKGKEHPKYGTPSPMKGKHHTAEARKKISIAMSGENNPNSGKLGLSGEKNPFFGKKHSKEQKEKWSRDRKGKNNHMFGRKGKDHPLSKKVKQINVTSGKIIKVWDSLSDAQRELNLGHISEVCNGKAKTNGGFKWEFVKYILLLLPCNIHLILQLLFC